MATDYVDQITIVNSAIVKVGGTLIQSIDQSTKSAQMAKALWNQVRDSVLRAHPWRFAIKRVTLAPAAAAPDWGYAYAFDKPNDCLRVLDLDDPDLDWVEEAGQILCDAAQINARYVFRNESYDQWDNCFAEAMAWRLAAELAYPLTQSLPLKQDCEKSYKAALAEARSMNAAEGILPDPVVDTWTNERF